MRHQNTFANGRHLAAARTMAGLKQIELAELAGLHVNSVKRLERMKSIYGSDHAVRRINEALRCRGIISETWPMQLVRIADEK